MFSEVDVVTCLFSQYSDGVQQESPMVNRHDPDGVEVVRTHLLQGLQVVVAVVDEVSGIVLELQKRQPLDDNVGLVAFRAAVEARSRGRRQIRRGRRRGRRRRVSQPPPRTRPAPGPTSDDVAVVHRLGLEVVQRLQVPSGVIKGGRGRHPVPIS